MRGYGFNKDSDFETVREIKEDLCFISHDINIDKYIVNKTTAYKKEYILPDKSIISIDRERFLAPEILFNPFIDGIEAAGVS